MKIAQKHTHPEDVDVYGQELEPGDVIQEGDLYRAKDSWVGAVGVAVPNNASSIWVRPLPEPPCTVGELIVALQKFDPKLPVYRHDYEWTCIKVKGQVERIAPPPVSFSGELLPAGVIIK